MKFSRGTPIFPYYSGVYLIVVFRGEGKEIWISPQPRGSGDNIKFNSPVDNLESFIEPLKPFLSRTFSTSPQLLCINNNNSTISVLKCKFMII